MIEVRRALLGRAAIVACLFLTSTACEPDETVSCEAEVGECPNICTTGTGVPGEVCSGAADCMCGNFCNAGTCSAYEGEFSGCSCGGSTEPDAGLGDCPLAEPEGARCNPYCQLGCDADEQCSLGGSIRCTGVGAAGLGEACSSSGDCQRGLACFMLTGEMQQTCHTFCISDADCPDERSCNLRVNFSGGESSAQFCGNPSVGCNPFAPSAEACPDGEVCTYTNNSTVCRPPGTLAEDEVCHRSSDSCQEGLQCLVRCSRICSLGTDEPSCATTCPAGEFLEINADNGIGICLDGTPNTMCDLYAQTGCPTGESCYTTRGGFACFSTGETEPGAVCDSTNDCTAGHICVNNSCHELCDASPTADPAHSCETRCETTGTLRPAAWNVGFCTDAEPTEPCDFWAPECPSGTNCYVLSIGASCAMPSGSAALGEACSSPQGCAVGLYCDSSVGNCIQPCSILEVGVPTGTPICIDVCSGSFSPISITAGIGKCDP